jgi:hypothetical protein
MELLFKREQTGEGFRGVRFKLWAKLELDEEELRMIDHYRLDNAILIEGDESDLIKWSIGIGIVVWLLFGSTIGLAMAFVTSFGFAAFISLGVGIAAGVWWLNEKRETIMVIDLLQGRHFKCKSVIELAKKEAWVEGTVATLRQVMEGSKH